MFNNVLILSPHTDDAELGCGGTIIRLIEAGKNILWVVLSTAEESLPKGYPADALVVEFKSVISKLGLKKDNFIIYHFKVRHLYAKRQEILEELIKIREDFRPDLVIGPSLNDFHQDHTVVANEMVRAFKTTSSIICYELPWNHVNFQTQFFVKLSEEQIGRKIELLKSYKTQFVKHRSYFSADFVRGLAVTRGSQVDHKYAEAFEVVRSII
jgi:LmbE family N-acetylglucosaminyl deacetylase